MQFDVESKHTLRRENSNGDAVHFFKVKSLAGLLGRELLNFVDGDDVKYPALRRTVRLLQ